ncbi:MAG: hypothetical protein WC320_00095 [Candidatus Paceibacterota bacterium]|jgi:hypothetical protein
MKRRIKNKKAINKKLLPLRRPPRLEGEAHKFGVKPVKKERRK